MVTYFISPFEPPQWTGEIALPIEVDSFRRELSARWPTIHFTKSTGEEHILLDWDIDNQGIEGSLLGQDRAPQVVSIRGPVDGIAEFVAWYRSFVPAEYQLFFFSEGQDIHMLLEAYITEQRVRNALMGG